MRTLEVVDGCPGCSDIRLRSMALQVAAALARAGGDASGTVAAIQKTPRVPHDMALHGGVQ